MMPGPRGWLLLKVTVLAVNVHVSPAASRVAAGSKVTVALPKVLFWPML
jgi:hypothetical protein